MSTPSWARGTVRAVLGPTNTGKTHLAIDRMLGHASGMIGFPLRLLARENYDRIASEKGRASVALVTGEEKIIPPTARWWVCTVESMPTDKPVDFLAVDEIQLAADPERGHVFTDRLLSARGLEETMFLGSESIAGLIRALVPDVRIESRARFSTLSYTGSKRLTKLPRRSAIVAFSINEVYEIAELVRRQRGGTAVVLGALSPRTRNAQVAMYQSGEVDYLVATDAIGMGLNMDIDHVAFANLTKFDGQRVRPLHAPEIGQIAGRAGRHMNDGTFGVTNHMPGFDDETVEAVENHEYPPITRIHWRNRDLDFKSPARLLKSLSMPPPSHALVRTRDADDHTALAALARDEEIVKRATTPDMVHLLWDVCQVPDFRKIMPEHHVGLLARLYLNLSEGDGRLPQDWVASQIGRLDRTDGDIDTLTQRLAHVRTWSYISHRGDWLDDAEGWRSRTRSIEDILSDALHDRLIQRFVDKRAALLIKGRSDDGELLSAVTKDGQVIVEGHVIGRMEGLRFKAEDAADLREEKALATAAHKAVRNDAALRAKAIASAEDGDITLDPAGMLHWRGTPVARLVRGQDALHPRVAFLPHDIADTEAEAKALQKLQIWIERQISAHLETISGAIVPAAEIDGAARGILYRLAEGLGSVPLEDASEQIAALTVPARKSLGRLGVRFGTARVFAEPLLRPEAIRLRMVLWSVWHNQAHDTLPNPSKPSHAADRLPHEHWIASGYVPVGPVAIRMERFERFAHRLRQVGAKGAKFRIDDSLRSITGVRNDEVMAAVLRAMGFRGIEGEDGALEFSRKGNGKRPRRKAAKALRTPSCKEVGGGQAEGRKKGTPENRSVAGGKTTSGKRHDLHDQNRNSRKGQKADRQKPVNPHSPFAGLRELMKQS